MFSCSSAFMLFGKPQSFLGVDIGAGGVKVVEIKKVKERPVLFTYGLTSDASNVHALLAQPKVAEPTPESSSALSGTKKSISPQIDSAEVANYTKLLKQVCKEIKTVGKTAVVSLPVSSVFHAVVTLPKVKKDEFMSILQAEIKKLLPYPMEEMAVDYQILPSQAGDTADRVSVHAVPRALVNFYTAIFRGAGLKLDSLEPESMAVSRALVGRDMATTMIIDIGAERTNFYIVDRTVPMTHNTIEMGGRRVDAILQNTLKIKPELVGRVKRDIFNYVETAGKGAASPDVILSIFNGFVDPILKEVEYSIDLFLRQSGNEQKRPEKIVLTGGAAHFPFLAGYIADKFKIKCYIGDPWGRVVYQDALRPVLRSIAPRMAVAIGLALRNMV